MKNNTTVTNLINSYLRHIPGQESLEDAPIVRRLSGSIFPNTPIQDYKEHLEEKKYQAISLSTLSIIKKVLAKKTDLN